MNIIEKYEQKKLEKYNKLKRKRSTELSLSELKFISKYERDLRKARFLISDEHFRSEHKTYLAFICIFSLICIIVFLLFFFNSRFSIGRVGTIICCVVCLLMVLGAYCGDNELLNEKINPYYNSLNSENSKKETADISVLDAYDNIDNSSKPDTGHLSSPKIDYDIKKSSSDEVIAIMLGNLTEINEYYRLSKRQAGWAFWSAIVSFFAGFVFLGVVIWILLNKSTDTLALIIPAIGTVVSELFGLTIFSVYKKSLNQLNSYYDSLHDNERFISLLYITDKLSDPMQRDELFTQIVKDQISTINRQKTKAEEQNAKKPSGKKVVLVKKNKKNNSKNP